MIKTLIAVSILFSHLAVARDYLCTPYCIVGTAVYNVGFDDTHDFVGYFSRNGRKYYWSRGHCVQQTPDVVRCAPDELKATTWVDISGKPGDYRAHVKHGESAATLDCR